MTSLDLRRRSCAAVLAAGALAAARADPASSNVPTAPDGDGLPAGPPVALCSSSLLVPVEGHDGAAGTADDATLLLSGLGSPPVTRVVLPTPRLSAARPLVRLAASRALACSAGADAAWLTPDDTLLRLGSLGLANEVTEIPLGRQADDVACTPEPLGADAAAMAVPGADGAFGTADDEIAVITGLDTDTPIVRRIGAAFLAAGPRTAPVGLSPALFLVSGCGADAVPGTADDELHVFKDLGAGFVRTSLAAPGLSGGASGRAVRLGSTSALAAGTGADLVAGTADDPVLLLRDLGGAGEVASLVVGGLSSGAGCAPTRLAEDRAVVVSLGTDGIAGTTDDRLVALTRLDGAPRVETLHETALGDGPQCRPQRLAARDCALAAAGPDGTWNTADDELVVTVGVGSAYVTKHVPVGALGAGITSQPCALSSDALLVCAGGADGRLGAGGDDAILLVRGLARLGKGDAATIESIPAAGDFDGVQVDAHRPTCLGGTRAALLASGPDGGVGVGDDDVVQVLDGVPAGLGLEVRKLRVRVRPKGGERIRVRARLRIDEPTDLAGMDLLVSLGECAQTLPGDAVRWRRDGSFRYRDRKASDGFVTELRFRARNELLLLRGRAERTGASDGDPARLRFTLEVGGQVSGEDLPIEESGKGWTHAPRPHGVKGL